jgi:hypothetical protein
VPHPMLPHLSAPLYLSPSLQLLHLEFVPPLRFINKIAVCVKEHALFF